MIYFMGIHYDCTPLGLTENSVKSYDSNTSESMTSFKTFPAPTEGS